MATFYSRPATVEAFQWQGGEVPGVVYAELADERRGEAPRYFVVTAHGQRAYLAPGDWVLAEPDGVHHYPCKPEIFETRWCASPPAAGGSLGRVVAAMEAHNRGKDEELRRLTQDPSVFEIAQALADELRDSLVGLCNYDHAVDGFGKKVDAVDLASELEDGLRQTFLQLTGRPYVPEIRRRIAFRARERAAANAPGETPDSPGDTISPSEGSGPGPEPRVDPGARQGP